MSKAGVCADGRLGDELAAILEPMLQDALNHPMRREILRILHSSEQPRSVTALHGQLPATTRAEVSYHVQVLQETGSIFPDGTRPAPGGRDVLYRSELASDPGVLTALGATDKSDRKRWPESPRGGPPSFLSMFRIPRPGRSIRLGQRDERREEAGS